MTAIRKDGALYCDPTLEFARGLPCHFCGAPPPSAPHHWPPKGMGGAKIDDTRVVPVCLICHKRCHGERVMTAMGLRPPITAAENVAAVDATLRRFLREAPIEMLERFSVDLYRWREGRGVR